MSRPIVQAQQQGGLHLFSSAFLLSIEKACGNHYQGSWGQLGNEFTFLVQPNKDTPMSWRVATYPMYHAGDPHLGKGLENMLQSQWWTAAMGPGKDMALGRFAVVTGSWRTWKAKTQWVVGMKNWQCSQSPWLEEILTHLAWFINWTSD